MPTAGVHYHYSFSILYATFLLCVIPLVSLKLNIFSISNSRSRAAANLDAQVATLLNMILERVYCAFEPSPCFPVRLDQGFQINGLVAAFITVGGHNSDSIQQ
jgi:hypothetical protein